MEHFLDISVGISYPLLQSFAPDSQLATTHRFWNAGTAQPCGVHFGLSESTGHSPQVCICLGGSRKSRPALRGPQLRTDYRMQTLEPLAMWVSPAWPGSSHIPLEQVFANKIPITRLDTFLSSLPYVLLETI